MKKTTLLTVALLFVLVSAVPAMAQKKQGKEPAAKETTTAAPAEKVAEAPAGSYKIGVINRKKILSDYRKAKADYEVLQNEVEKRQTTVIKPLDDSLKAAKADYDKGKDKMSREQRDAAEANIMNLTNKYKAEMATQQGEIDLKEKQWISGVSDKINAAVSEIATNENYHLVLDGGDRTSVVFSSATIDITQKVVDKLNASN